MVAKKLHLSWWVTALCAVVLTACGGGGSSGSGSSTPPAQTYKLGGTISGIQSGNQVMLSNGSDTITLTANGSFTFDQGVAPGTAFNVSASASAQACIALFSSGTMTSAGVSNVQVQCGPLEQKTFHAVGAINVARSGASLFALPDGSAVLVGGTPITGTNLLLAFEHFDPVMQAWTAYSVAAPAVSIQGAAKLANNTILISTGAATQVFDPVAGTLSAANPFASLTGATILLPLLDGRVMASDGSTIELLDPTTGKWSVGPAMTTDHGMQPAFVLMQSGKVLVSGGLALPQSIANSEVFDPVAGTWTAVGSMATSRTGHTMILMPGGKVLAVGGATGETVSFCGCGFSPVAAAEMFDPTTGQWSAAGALATARLNATANLMPTGKVLVVGGNLVSQFEASSTAYKYTLPTTLASAEVYDPQTNTWSAWGSLLNARTAHAATLLSSGELLVASGYVSVQGNDPGLAANWSNQPVLASELGW